MKCFENASGAKVNKNKTFGLYTGAWKNKIPEFNDIKWTTTNIKTLGIHHGYEIDDATIWLEKINKIKNCIQVWKSRDLTYKGKVLIIKTLLLSQIGFIADVVSIPNNIVKQIDTLLWSFLWDSKQPLVNRNVMLQNALMGGVNMSILQNTLICKQIKFLYKMIIAENAHWNQIGKHWLQKYDSEYRETFFLCKCSCVKGLNVTEMPDFYQKCVSSWALFIGKLKIQTKEHILNETLFGNIAISARSNPIFYSDFSRCNIKTIRDIWDVQKDDFHTEQYIQNKSAATPNWRQKYNKLKANIPESWINILKSNNAQTQTNKYCIEINNELKLYMNDKFVEPSKFSLKLINRHVIDNTHKPKCETKWEALFNRTFSWKSIWESFNNTLCSNKEKQFQWKIIHNAVFTEHKLQLMNLSNGLCNFCKSETEDIRHLFFACPITHAVFRNIQDKINIVLNEMYSKTLLLECHHVILGYIDGPKKLQGFVNFCLVLMKWEIWKFRNNVKFNNRNFAVNEISKQILQKISGARDFISRTRMSGRQEHVLNMLEKLEQTQTRE